MKNVKKKCKRIDCIDNNYGYFWRKSIEIRKNSTGKSATTFSERVEQEVVCRLPDEGEEGSEGLHDVGVVRARPLDHAAQLSVAVRT